MKEQNFCYQHFRVAQIFLNVFISLRYLRYFIVVETSFEGNYCYFIQLSLFVRHGDAAQSLQEQMLGLALHRLTYLQCFLRCCEGPRRSLKFFQRSRKIQQKLATI